MQIPCSACGHPETSVDPFYYDWEGDRFWIRRCRACTHQFVYPHISPDQQSAIYSDAYFKEGGDWVCGVWGGSYEDQETNLRDEAAAILEMVGSSEGRLLDIGCAGGVFLDCARDAGFEVEGLEINPRMAALAAERFGLSVRSGRVEDVAEGWNDLDVVTLLDVLEHIPEPLRVLEKIRDWTRPGARLFIRGPLANSRIGGVKERLRRIGGWTKQLPGYPLDANMFNRRSITAMLLKTGFEPAQWWEAPGFANVLAERR